MNDLGVWFASTACPLLVGTFGPLANAFNICSLVQPWRSIGGFHSVEDPSWLLISNIVSLVIGVIANLLLLLHMGGQIRFSIAQPITTAGFFLASFILIALTIYAPLDTFSGQPDISLSESYFYATFAAGIYFVIASLNAVTVAGALRNKYAKQLHLTTNQRTLMLHTISFMGYMVIGAAVFSDIEGWRYVDGFYWSNFTLLTIGIGPFIPTTRLGRCLLMPYAIGGVFVLGLIVGSIRSMILQSATSKLRARTVSRSYHLAKSDMGTPREDFDAVRQIQRKAHLKYRYLALAVSALGTIVLWFVGALIFWRAEKHQKWTYFESVYFSYTSLMTIGYGDYLPASAFGRTFFVFWGLLAIPALTVLISDIGDTIIKWVERFTIWLGSMTILPYNESIWNAVRSSAKRTQRELIQRFSGKRKQVPDTLVERDPKRHGSSTEVLQVRLGDMDCSSWRAYDEESSKPASVKNIEFYMFVLHKEIISMLQDSHTSPPKRWTYDEWVYFLTLLQYRESEFDWWAVGSPLRSGKDETDWLLNELLGAMGRLLLPVTGGLEYPAQVTPITLDMLENRVRGEANKE